MPNPTPSISSAPASAKEAPTPVHYGERAIHYTVARSARATLAIHVHPDQSVDVRAPNDATAQQVRDKVKKRARWIVTQQDDFADFVQARVPREYVSGETHRYLGRQYRLKVIPIAEDEPERVKLIGPYFRIYTHGKGDATHVKAQLDTWYRAHAKTKFAERLEAAHDIMRRYGIEKPPLRVRRMEKRWGSCTASGTVLLNPDLIRAPRLCVDYVVLHELCHIKHPHHGPAFYELLTKVMPDWKEQKARLRDVQF